MKLMPLKFIFALILLTVFKVTIPMTITVGMEGASPMASKEQSIKQTCHFNKMAVSKICCYTGCDLKQATFSFGLNTELHIASTTQFNIVVSRLYSIYSQPFTPPPIQA